MAREYFCAYHSYLKSMRNLSDAECGRLFRALLQYSAGDTSINLQGRESIAFDFISEQIDRDNAAYNAKCETNRKNGSLANGGGRNRTGANAPQEKGEGEEKGKEKNIPPNPPAGGTDAPPAEKPKRKRAPPTPPDLTPDEESALLAFSPGLCAEVRDWFRYKAERKQMYGDVFRRKFVANVTENARKYGADAVAAVIRDSAASGYKGVTWDKLSTPQYGGGNAGQPPRKSWAELAAEIERERSGQDGFA